MAAQGMTLRNMHLVGGTQRRVEVPAAHRAAFEEGCALIFTRWTALQLGVQNEWGGSHSRQKAGDLLRDTINWFYNTKDHEMFDLQDLLDEALQVDFNIQAEDDSPYQVARQLVNMHNQVAAGDFSYVEQMRAAAAQAAAAAAAAAAASQRAPNGLPEADEDSSSSVDEEDGSDDDDAMDAEGGEDMDMDDAPQQPQGPVVDEDGFQVVQRKGRGRR
ncbi:pre-rRNA-processing TSR2-like protein [Micractinium conductrix]|uniref:Pre-rRNA-processing TSR2-like protein n=1 Tax=Micractinium conductrix TaxID=554055 RepID=A0A2P6V965_9CHLO|nr:pre-rRNA-processing TSR2-like protein [Micractinium conductrix]|eukprot:PSC70621.1 pre-rRNA-processing TSR2-like protein [Micractinium conductrix]